MTAQLRQAFVAYFFDGFQNACYLFFVECKCRAVFQMRDCGLCCLCFIV